jgi:hypothetical protein
MKKLNKLLILLLVVATFTLTACSSSNVEGPLTEIMDKIYSDIKEDERPMLETVNILEQETESLDDLIIYTIGTKDIEYKEIYESRPMIGSIAYSVVLVRMEEGADIEAAKTAIKDNVDPRKWFCVWVEPEDVIIKSKGDLIILIMVEDETLRTKLEKGFDNL